jgi:nucleoside-diphosphate-sugar epimerase
VVSGSLANIDDASHALDDADTVIHLAAGMRGSFAELLLDTVVTTRNLLEASRMRRRPPRFVLVSSFSVYGIADRPRGAVVDESTPLEPHPEKRDAYAFAKLRQEQLLWSYAERCGVDPVVLRPGVVHGPGGVLLSSRVGLRAGPIVLFLGGDNIVPLSFVENCAEAIVVASSHPRGSGEAFNVHDDDLPTARELMKCYRRAVPGVRALPIPRCVTQLGALLIEAYHTHSQGQLPAVITPYRAATTYKPQRYDNDKIKRLGWRQLVPTEQALRMTFGA